MKILFAAISVLCALACAETAIAQRPKRQTKPPPKDSRLNQAKKEQAAPPMPVLPDIRNDPDVQDADVAIIANVTAKELRFDVVPNPTVEFSGKQKAQTIWHADRYNLPDQVEPGVTYRNIGIRLKITSRFADIERIVAEALGEIPIAEDEGEKPKNSSGDPKPPTAVSLPNTGNTPTKRVPNE